MGKLGEGKCIPIPISRYKETEDWRIEELEVPRGRTKANGRVTSSVMEYVSKVFSKI